MRVDRTQTGHQPSFSDNAHTHTVRKGENLTEIAKQHGISLGDLLQANPHLQAPDTIYPGMELALPSLDSAAPAATQSLADQFLAAPGESEICPLSGGDWSGADGVYTVQPGDSMWSIARRTGVSLNNLIRANPQIGDASRIYPGQRLTIPDSDSAVPVGRPRFNPPNATLYEGARGQHVTTLQNRLKELGFNPGAADGIFGPRTEAAVKAFQRAAGITVDGIVGPRTWAALAAGGVANDTPRPGETRRASDFVRVALAQDGDRYVYGAETRLDDPNPSVFDCSELVQWAAAQVGINFADGSSNQLGAVRRAGLEISVEQAMRTPGALLFKPGHVAISLGDGRTIEAKGSAYGVGIFNAAGRFTTGGLIPGMQY